jgi:hypothetical protein
MSGQSLSRLEVKFGYPTVASNLMHSLPMPILFDSADYGKKLYAGTTSVARILFKVLIAGSMVKSHTSTEEMTALDKCYRDGWLHADRFNDTPGGEEVGEVTVFTFPPHLYRWFVEWNLFKIDAPPLELNSILELAIKVIGGFCPTSLSTERRIGPGCIQRPPEAQYQEEFYRICYAYSKGQLKTFPEFGTTRGRVDFYVPSMK